MEDQQASQVGKLGVVFWISAVFSVVFLLWGAIFTGNLSTVTSAILNFVLNSFGWLYLVATTLFLFFVIYLAFSRFGKIKLGKDDEEPEFGRLSWFAMLFAAGMGIGLVFWGVAEPMSHYGTPPYNLAKPSSPEAAELGLRYAFFHWGLHPWAVYAVIALCLAYRQFVVNGHRGRSLRPRTPAQAALLAPMVGASRRTPPSIAAALPTAPATPLLP